MCESGCIAVTDAEQMYNYRSDKLPTPIRPFKESPVPCNLSHADAEYSKTSCSPSRWEAERGEAERKTPPLLEDVSALAADVEEFLSRG